MATTMTQAQDKADQLAETLSQVAGEKVTAEVSKGIGYVGLRIQFATPWGRDRALRFHTQAGGDAPKRQRGTECFWMFK